jgi:hypothetical protein
MTDETDIPGELADEDLEIVAKESGGLLQVHGSNTALMLKGPSPFPTPFDYIKDCVGMEVRMSPNPAKPDEYRYLVMVQDSFEWREIEACLNAMSEKEYEKTQRNFRTVN